MKIKTLKTYGSIGSCRISGGLSSFTGRAYKKQQKKK